MRFGYICERYLRFVLIFYGGGMRFFGIVGICGIFWEKVMLEFVMKVGMVVGIYKSGKVFVGRDGRIFSVMLKNVMIFGFLSIGMEVFDVDLIFIFVLVWGMRKFVDVGVMIMVSYNFFMDNGVKVFNGDGMEFYVE